MDRRLAGVIQDLLKRARRRGFVTMTEVQRELEWIEPPGTAFDLAIDTIRSEGMVVMEDTDDVLELPVLDTEAFPVTDPTRMYLGQIGRVPLLTVQQEVELAMAVEAGRDASKRLDRIGDGSPALGTRERAELERISDRGVQAHKRLVEANLRLVVAIAKRYLGNGMPLLDLIQEGNLGLMKGVDRFDYRKGFKFSTYASWWIRQSVSRALADQSRTIRIPVHMVETIYNLSRAQRRLHQHLGREPTIDELAGEIEVSPGRVAELSMISAGTLSLEMPVTERSDMTLADFVPDSDSDVAMNNAESSLLQEYVALVLEGLTDRERQVILMRFGLEDGKVRTLRELSVHFRVTRERIRQMETRALWKLRHNSERLNLKDYLRDG